MRRQSEISATSIAEAFQTMRNDYDAVRPSRFRRTITGYNPMGSGADYHIRNMPDFLRLIEFARYQDRNDQLIGQGVDRVASLTLRDGPKLEPQTGDDGANAEIKARFKAWSKDKNQCDIAGKHTLMSMAWLALRSVIVDGDCFFFPLKDGRLQYHEAHRAQTPKRTRRNVVLGIMQDDFGKPLQYWFTKEDKNSFQQRTLVSEINRRAAFDKFGNPGVFHVMNPKRFSQSRGITAFAPIFDTIGMHGDIQFAKLVQQQIVSCFAILRERPESDLGPQSVGTGTLTQETNPDGTTRTLQGVAPGMDITSAPGEKITGFSPSVPNAEFFNHVMLILTIISVNLGVPVHILLLDPTKTNFSGWRGALDAAKPGLKHLLNRVIVDGFLCPTYHWKLRQWVAEDAALRKLGDAVFLHQWTPPFTPYIEPSKDAIADAKIIDNGLNSRRSQLAARGLDIDDVDNERVKDQDLLIRRAIKAAEQLKKDFPGAVVDWRELLGGDAPAITIQSEDPQKPKEPNNAK